MYYNTEARLPYVKPEEMNEKQKEFYNIHLKAFQTMPYVWLTENKELNGPSNLLCHEVDLGMEFIPLNRDIIATDIQRNGGAAHSPSILTKCASVASVHLPDIPYTLAVSVVFALSVAVSPFTVTTGSWIHYRMLQFLLKELMA